jgi:hypothetical protein
MEKGTPILDPDAPTETKQAEETAKETQKKVLAMIRQTLNGW